MKLKNIIVLAELDNGKIHQVIATQDQKLQFIGMLMKGGNLQLMEEPMPLEVDHKIEDDICKCEMPSKMKGENKCWRCKKQLIKEIV